MKIEKNNMIVDEDWGYAVIDGDKLWIPVIIESQGGLGNILIGLHKKTGIKRMIFSAVLNPEELKSHLRNIVKEWDEWNEEAKDYSHCIEILFEAKP